MLIQYFFFSFYFHVSVSGNDPPTRENIFKISTSSSKCQTCYLFFQNINSVDSTPTTAKYYDTILIHRILLKQLHKKYGHQKFYVINYRVSINHLKYFQFDGILSKLLSEYNVKQANWLIFNLKIAPRSVPSYQIFI